MCDPVSLALASTAIGAVGSVGSSMAAASAQKKQAREVSLWQQEQKQFRQQEQIRQDALRQQADKSRQEGLDKLSAESQNKQQSDEEARLAAELTGQGQQPTAEAGAPISVADKELAEASSQTDSEQFKSDMARKINEATTGARQRLGALARVSSFGQSFGGLGRTNQEALAQSGAGIDEFNEFRRGSLGAFGTERAIEPVQVTYTPGVGSALAQAALQFGTQGLGNAWGGAAKTAAGTSSLAGKIGPIIPGVNTAATSLAGKIGPIIPGVNTRVF